MSSINCGECGILLVHIQSDKTTIIKANYCLICLQWYCPKESCILHTVRRHSGECETETLGCICIVD